MKFYHFLIAFILSTSLSWSQGNLYSYSLTLNDSTHSLEGIAKLTFVNSQPLALDTIYVHLPSRSLEYKKSFLHQQLAEFQKVDAYYAKKEERGFITISEMKAGNATVSVCKKCEFIAIPLSEPLSAGDSITIFLEFDLKLGSSEFNGTGYDGEVYRVIDWLPHFPILDTTEFRLYPVTFQRDIYPSLNTYELELSLPADMIVATNATLITNSELARLDSLKALPFNRPPSVEGYKTLNFIHTGTNLHFMVSAHFFVFPMDNGGSMYVLNQDLYYPSTINKVNQEIDIFFKKQFGDIGKNTFDLVLLPEKSGEFQSDGLLSLQTPKDLFKLSSELCHARAEMIFRYGMRPDGFQSPWLARGLPYFYKYTFINENYPDKKWLPFSNSFIGKFFALDQFDYSYQNQFLYLYLARQNLDQPMSASVDSLTRLNYEAIAQAKVYMALSHFREYMGAYNFGRAINKFYTNHQGQATAQNLKKSFYYYSNKPIDWFFKDWLNTTGTYDYRLVKTEYCPTISTATVTNTGTLTLPYSLTGIKDGKPVLTQWYEGHTGKKSVQMYHADYDEVILNYPGRVPEYSQRNNTYYNRLLFPRMEPLSLPFYYSFEDPKHSQLYWTPTINFNAYDKVLLGVSLDNSSLVQKPFEYIIGPEYSTGTGRLTGYTSFICNILPRKSKLFHQIRVGVFGRYYHYDEDLTYLRISPAVNFYFKKPYPTSSILQNIRFRVVNLDRELPSNFNEPANQVGNSSFSVFNATYKYEETNIFKPYTLQGDFYWGDQFSRLGIEGDFRWMLPNKKWLIWRNYAGYFFTNKFAAKGIKNNYYSLGHSGTRDFLFDYQFFGRSDSSGIWSQQTFITEGGFKSQTNAFADNWIISTNVVLPIWSVFGVFADAGLVDNIDKLYYDCGIRIALVTDFLEIYFPLINQDQNFLKAPAYYNNIRFVLDIDQTNIINRLRRGYY